MIKGARKEGVKEGREETARKMKEWGDSIEKIYAITGLSIERIEKL
jgi:predicted transposase YdaD